MAVKMNKTYCGDGFPNLPDFKDLGVGDYTAGDGIAISDAGAISVDAGDGLAFSEDGEIVPDLGDGLTLDASDKIVPDVDGTTIGVNTTSKQLECLVTGAYDYSTTEFDTGQKWVDGKTLYGRVLHFTEETEQTTKIYDLSSINADFGFLGFWAIKSGAAGNSHWLSGAQYVSNIYDRNIAYDIDSNVISVTCVGWGFTEVYAIIYYTKPTTP